MLYAHRVTTRASGADVCALRGPTRMVLRVASQLLPSGHRQRFLREWTAEAVTPGSDVSQFVFAVRVLRGALGTSLALRDGVERALFQLGLAVPFAATGPLFFIGLALYRNDLGPAAGYALFVLALFIGGLSVWQGHLEALAHTRTHVAGAALAVSNLFMAALPSKLPTD